MNIVPWQYYPYTDPWMEADDDMWKEAALLEMNYFTLDSLMQKYPLTQEMVSAFLEHHVQMPIVHSPLSYDGQIRGAPNFMFQIAMHPKYFSDNFDIKDAGVTLVHETIHGIYRAKGSFASSLVRMIDHIDYAQKNYGIAREIVCPEVLDYYARENLIELCAQEFCDSNKEYVDHLVRKYVRSS